jgi:hypothetical protein
VSPSVRDQLPNTPSVVPQQTPCYQTRRPATESVTKVGLKTGVALAAMEDVVPASDYELALCSIGPELALARQTLAAATEKAKTAARAAAAAGISERAIAAGLGVARSRTVRRWLGKDTGPATPRGSAC